MHGVQLTECSPGSPGSSSPWPAGGPLGPEHGAPPGRPGLGPSPGHRHPGPVRILRFYASVGTPYARPDRTTLLFRARTPKSCAFPPCRAPGRRRIAASTWCPNTPRTTRCWPKASMAPSATRSFTLSVQSLPAAAAVRASVCRAAQNHHPHPQPHQFIKRRRQAPQRGRTAIFRTASGSDARRSPPPRNPSSPACAPVPRRSCRWWT